MERKPQQVPTPAPSSSVPPAAPPPEEQKNEPGWLIACRPLFWFLVLPAGGMLLIKWLLQL